MTTNENAHVYLGPDTDAGYQLEVVNGFNDGTTDYITTHVLYHLQGVADVDIQDAYQTGGRPNSVLNVEFVNGASIRVEGVISEININGGDTDA